MTHDFTCNYAFCGKEATVFICYPRTQQKPGAIFQEPYGEYCRSCWKRAKSILYGYGTITKDEYLTVTLVEA